MDWTPFVSGITHIRQLKPDQRNARKHNPRNIGMIANALNDVGAARSIVIDEDDNILAGNGTVEAAAQAGIERVRVVDADGEEIIAVRRTGLTVEQKQRLALYDNRTAELATWDAETLGEIAGEIDTSFLFSVDELAAVLGSGAANDPDTSPQLGALEYRIVIDCSSEAHQSDLLARFEDEGLTCRALIS